LRAGCPLSLYAFAANNPNFYVDPYGLVNWSKIGKGTVGLLGGIVAAFALTVAEPASLGTTTILLPSVFFGITSGAMEIGAGIKDDPHDEATELFLASGPKMAMVLLSGSLAAILQRL
jgi:hypothetical protein